jgi:hypothetical protein
VEVTFVKEVVKVIVVGIESRTDEEDIRREGPEPREELRGDFGSHFLRG